MLQLENSVSARVYLYVVKERNQVLGMGSTFLRFSVKVNETFLLEIFPFLLKKIRLFPLKRNGIFLKKRFCLTL